ncbi:hypothetical protein PMAYCL1PPCAC_28967 [Pristionchus mayeri]|uniref:Protein zwilch n=1 Tax=Pristionchus mayeri TaxID=1317129 RepID=A0AAN5DA03_9BILA|nr:hypothetical protein PMAYCL1PPCAC_28967 [Pristionchus mayeri]
MTHLQITGAHTATTNPELFHNDFRVRLIDNRVLPIVGNDSLFNLQQLVIIDYPDAERSTKHEMIEEDKENIMDTTNSNGQIGGGSPLKFEFLTLDKLKESDADLLNFKVTIRSITENAFPVKPIPVEIAFKLRQGFYDSDEPLFDASIPSNSPIFIACDASDEMRTVYVGIQKTKSACRLFSTVCTGGLDEDGREAILDIVDGMSSMGESQCNTRMHIEMLRPRPHKREEEVDNTVDALSSLVVDYQSDQFDIACMPPSTAHATLTFYPGWCDPRLEFDAKTKDLQLMMVMANALHNNTPFNWDHAGESKKKDADIQAAVRALIADTNKQVITDESKRYIDFTEHLWEILRECRSNELLIKCLQIIFSALRSNSISTILHDDNLSNLGSLIRASCKGQPIHIPRLEGLTPVELLLEIAVERFRRDTITEYVKRSYVTSEGDIRDMLKTSVERVRASESAQRALTQTVDFTRQAVEDTRALLPLHLGLQTMAHLEETLKLAHRNTLAKTTKDVITRYMSKEITNFHDVYFEMRVPLVQVKEEVIPGLKPASFSTEVVYKNKGEERTRTHIFLARTPPLRGLEGVLTNVEDPSNRYVATVTKCSTVANRRAKTA